MTPDIVITTSSLLTGCNMNKHKNNTKSIQSKLMLFMAIYTQRHCSGTALSAAVQRHLHTSRVQSWFLLHYCPSGVSPHVCLGFLQVPQIPPISPKHATDSLHFTLSSFVNNKDCVFSCHWLWMQQWSVYRHNQKCSYRTLLQNRACINEMPPQGLRITAIWYCFSALSFTCRLLEILCTTYDEIPKFLTILCLKLLGGKNLMQSFTEWRTLSLGCSFYTCLCIIIMLQTFCQFT